MGWGRNSVETGGVGCWPGRSGTLIRQEWKEGGGPVHAWVRSWSLPCCADAVQTLYATSVSTPCYLYTRTLPFRPSASVSTPRFKSVRPRVSCSRRQDITPWQPRNECGTLHTSPFICTRPAVVSAGRLRGCLLHHVLPHRLSSPRGGEMMHTWSNPTVSCLGPVHPHTLCDERSDEYDI